MILCEVGFNEFAPVPRYTGVGAFLIELHETAVPGDIGREDCRKASHRSFGRGRTVPSPAYRMNWTARSIGVTHW